MLEASKTFSNRLVELLMVPLKFVTLFFEIRNNKNGWIERAASSESHGMVLT